MNGVSSLLDRRAFGRRRIFIHATILIPGRPPSPCMMRNFSRGGALLQLSERLEPPFAFDLRFDLTGERIVCEVRHVRRNWLGVQFAGADVEGCLRRALGERGVRRPRYAAPGTLAPLPRISGRDLRRTILGKS